MEAVVGMEGKRQIRNVVSYREAMAGHIDFVFVYYDNFLE